MKKQFKTIALGCVAFASLTACNSDKFTINATIANLEDQQVYLAKDDKDNGMVYLDTVTAKDGRFTFTGKMDRNDYRIITFQNMPGEVRIYMDNSKIDLTGDYLMLDSVKVEGSPAMDFYKSFLTEEEANKEYIQEKYKLYQNAEQAKDTAAMQQINMQVVDYQKAYAKKVLDKAIERPEDIISLILLSNYVRTLNPDAVAEYYKMVPDDIKQDFRIGGFDAYMRDNIIKVAKGNPVPAFNLYKYENDSITQETVKGKMTALYITTEQVPDNEAVFKALKKAADKNVDVNIVLMFITKDTPKEVAEFKKEYGIENFGVAVGTEEFLQALAAMSPRVYFIDAEGKFAGTALDSAEVDAIVGEL